MQGAAAAILPTGMLQVRMAMIVIVREEVADQCRATDRRVITSVARESGFMHDARAHVAEQSPNCYDSILSDH